MSERRGPGPNGGRHEKSVQFKQYELEMGSSCGCGVNVNDESSGDEDLGVANSASEDEEVFPTEELDSIQWGALMISSLRASECREYVKEHTYAFEELWLKAQLFEAVSFAELASKLRKGGAPERVRQQRRAEQQRSALLEKLGLDPKDEPSLPTLQQDFERWKSTVNEFSPCIFMQFVCLFREDEGNEKTVIFRLLESLSLELEWERVKDRLNILGLTDKLPLEDGTFADRHQHHWTPWSRTVLGRGGFDVIAYEGEDLEEEGFFQKISTKKFPPLNTSIIYWFWHSLVSMWTLLSHGSNSNSFTATYSISPAVQLLSCHEVELAMMLKEMTLLAPQSRAFTTVLGRAVLAQAAEHTYWSFRSEIIVDVGFIFNLTFIAHDVSRSQVPSMVVVLILGILALATFTSLFARIITSLCFFRNKKHGLRCSDHAVVLWKTMAFWTLTQVGLELFSVGLVVWYMWCIQMTDWVRAKDQVARHGGSPNDWKMTLWFFLTDKFEMFQRHNSVKTSFLSKHPNLLSGLILFRWMHFIIALFQVESVGRNIVPVIHAVRQPESLFFMLFLLFALAASCHAYAVYPIDENVDETFNAILKIFRLEFLGDFDLDEMEGLDNVITGTVKNHTINAQLEESAYNQRFHQGIRTQFIFLSLCITLVAMNTYIGLLGELYSQAVTKKNQLYSHYVASTTYQHLCLTIAFRRCPCRARRHVYQHVEGMYWMAYNKALMKDPDPDD